MLVRRTVVTALALALFALSPAAAQSAKEIPALQLFAQQMRRGATYDHLLRRLGSDFVQLGVGADAITAADISVHRTMRAAADRVRRGSKMMARDLDGDGFVTEGELRRALAYEQRRSALGGGSNFVIIERTMVEQWSLRDTNSDGRVSWLEASAMPGPETREGQVFARSMRQLADKLDLVLQLDADGDGRVTLPEYIAPAELLFRAVDANSDGTISEEEQHRFQQDQLAFVSSQARAAALAAARKREEETRMARAKGETVDTATCAMPAPSAEAQVIGIGAQNLKALSSVAIGTQDKAVHVGHIVVEPGDTPVYLVMASSDAAIWQVTGAVDRVEHLVLHSITSIADTSGTNVPLVGATGVPPARVTLLGRSKCMQPFTEVPSVAAAQAAAFIREKTNREATMFASPIVGEVHVPSGEMPDAEPFSHRWPRYVVPGYGTVRIVGEPGRTTVITEPLDAATEMKRNAPGGVVEIDPAAVVSSLPAERYAIAPAEAGLLQLLDEGAVTVNARGEYLIHKKIRIPAGLRATFLLLRGVPEPDGSAGGSRIFSEETGRALDLRGR